MEDDVPQVEDSREAREDLLLVLHFESNQVQCIADLSKLAAAVDVVLVRGQVCPSPLKIAKRKGVALIRSTVLEWNL